MVPLQQNGNSPHLRFVLWRPISSWISQLLFDNVVDGDWKYVVIIGSSVVFWSFIYLYFISSFDVFMTFRICQINKIIVISICIEFLFKLAKYKRIIRNQAEKWCMLWYVMTNKNQIIWYEIVCFCVSFLSYDVRFWCSDYVRVVKDMLYKTKFSSSYDRLVEFAGLLSECFISVI